MFPKCLPERFEARFFRRALLDVADSRNIPIKLQKFRSEICQQSRQIVKVIRLEGTTAGILVPSQRANA